MAATRAERAAAYFMLIDLGSGGLGNVGIEWDLGVTIKILF